MQLTIDVKDTVVDKIMYLLDSLKSDVKIISQNNSNTLDIKAINKDDKDYQYIIDGREDRKNNPENYGMMDDISWD